MRRTLYYQIFGLIPNGSQAYWRTYMCRTFPLDLPHKPQQHFHSRFAQNGRHNNMCHIAAAQFLSLLLPFYLSCSLLVCLVSSLTPFATQQRPLVWPRRVSRSVNNLRFSHLDLWHLTIQAPSQEVEGELQRKHSQL